MTASLVGVFSVWRSAGKFIERNLDFLISFSAGVFLIIAYHLGSEAVEKSPTINSGLAWIIIGVIAVWILFKLLPSSHHHHHGKDLKEEMHSRLDARRIMFGDALHNIGDGVLLAASFAVGSSLGALTALSIFIHELVQEVSEFFVLKQAGYSTRKALYVNFAVSSTVLIGSLGGLFLLEEFEMFEVPILGLASGAFLIVVLNDLIPHSVRNSKRKKIYVRHILSFVVGAFLMYLISTIFAAH